jgi:hypothetical protein
MEKVQEYYDKSKEARENAMRFPTHRDFFLHLSKQYEALAKRRLNRLTEEVETELKRAPRSQSSA